MRHKNSISLRVPSSADHSTSSMWLRARVTLAIEVSSTCSGVMLSFTRMCSGGVAITVWRRRAGDHRVLGAPGDLADRLEVAFGGDREAGLDDVDAHVVEHFGDFELLLEAHGGAGALFAVAQGGVEYNDAVLVGLVDGGHRRIPLAGALLLKR